MGDPRFTIAQLRTELQELAESVTGYAPPPKPDRFDRRDPNKAGPVWIVPALDKLDEATPRLVRVIETADGAGAVFVEGGPYLWGGDMEALTVREARAYAMALLAAADWAAGQDVVGQRRARVEAGTD